MCQFWLNSNYFVIPLQLCPILVTNSCQNASNLEICQNQSNDNGFPAEINQNIEQQDLGHENNGLSQHHERRSQEITERNCINFNCSLRKYWNSQQDEKLKKLFNLYPNQWKKVAKKFKNRNESMCYSRYQRLIRGKTKVWTRQIDQKIVENVELIGFHWKQISKNVPNKTPKQIRQRYLNFLRPNIIKTQWTEEEDIKICQLVDQLGRRWKKFQSFLPGRTENQIKGRFYGHLKKYYCREKSNQTGNC